VRRGRFFTRYLEAFLLLVDCSDRVTPDRRPYLVPERYEVYKEVLPFMFLVRDPMQLTAADC